VWAEWARFILPETKNSTETLPLKSLNEKLSSDNANLQRFIREAKAASAC